MAMWELVSLNIGIVRYYILSPKFCIEIIDT